MIVNNSVPLWCYATTPKVVKEGIWCNYRYRPTLPPLLLKKLLSAAFSVTVASIVIVIVIVYVYTHMLWL